MDTLDNANNPFAIPNKTTIKPEDGLLLDFDEELKKNDAMPNNDLIKMLEKSNCDRLSPDFDKEDNLGPETNVDNPDDGPASPNFDTMKRQAEALNNNQNCNPFNDIEKSLELNLNLKAGTFEGMTSPAEEECCVPTANSVHNVSQLIDAGAESDSEEDEEWNYVRGEEANKENSNPLQLSSQVAEEEAEDLEDEMSQLNPNAAEFIPSPARVVASPLGRLLDEDQVISRSPKKPPPTEVDINVPNQRDFEKDISLKPHELEEAFSNGHQDEFNNDTTASKGRQDEFIFGPNASPFTPAKLLDRSENSSTWANYGDESVMSLGTSFNDSVQSQDQNDLVQKDDPMSMSFHQDRTDDSNLFDLNKVHLLPEDVDEFIAKADNSNSLLDDTISDLTEHYPLGKPEEISEQTEKEFITDLDHEDEIIVHLRHNLSSTPKDERSHSPSDTQTSVDDDRLLSPREEIKTPFDEPSQASSIEECKISKDEDHLAAQDNEQSRLESPNEQNRLNTPLEDDRKSPYDEKEMYSTQEEKDVCSPVEEKEVYCLLTKHEEPQNEEKEVFEEKDLLSEKDIIQEEKVLMQEEQITEDKESIAEKEVTEEKDVLEELEVHNRETRTPIEAIASPDSSRDLISPIQETEISSQIVNEEILDIERGTLEIAPHEAEKIVLPTQEQILSPLVEQVSSTLLDEQIERNFTSPLQEAEVSSEQESPVQDKEVILSSQEECSLVRETVESPSLEQEISTAEIDEGNFTPIEPSESMDKLVIDEPVELTTTCDNLESPEQGLEPPKNEEFLKFETEKSDEEKAKENLESAVELDKNVDLLCDLGRDSEVKINLSEASPLKDVTSFGSTEQSGLPLDLGNLEQSLEANQCSLNKSATDTSSINTTSFLERSVFDEVKCPISPNLSANETSATCDTSSLLKIEESVNISQSSPVKGQQPDLLKVTSTPKADKLESSKPTEGKSPALSKTKEAEKKPTLKAKGTTPTTTKKAAVPSPKPALAPNKTATKPSPRPATKTVSKTNTAPSKVNNTTVSKVASKTTTSATTAKPSAPSNRVPLSSRTTTTTTKTNGTTRPATRPATGTIKKTTEVSSTRSASTAQSRSTTSSARPTTLSSARSTTATAPKPRPNTLKPAATRTVDPPKPTTARTSAAAPRVPLTARTTTAKTSSTLASSAKNTASNTLSKPRSVTDKQVKDTANKLTAASRTVSKTTGTAQVQVKTTTTTKRSEVTGTKTTSRTNVTTSKAPIKKPLNATKAATTKVDKPKQNGVAPVVAEKLIVNNAPKEPNTVTSNGDQHFVKDNSPVDNKLITDQLSEAATN